MGFQKVIIDIPNLSIFNFCIQNLILINVNGRHCQIIPKISKTLNGIENHCRKYGFNTVIVDLAIF